jgi:hypothetical protein
MAKDVDSGGTRIVSAVLLRVNPGSGPNNVLLLRVVL